MWRGKSIYRGVLMDSLDEEEKNTICTMLDAFIGKKELKDTVSNMLKDVK